MNNYGDENNRTDVQTYTFTLHSDDHAIIPQMSNKQI